MAEELEIVDLATNVKDMEMLRLKMIKVFDALDNLLKVRADNEMKTNKRQQLREEHQPKMTGQQRVDYVIVCNQEQLNKIELSMFLKNISNFGVLSDITEGIVYKELMFIKMEIPERVLAKYADIYDIHLHYKNDLHYNPSRLVSLKCMQVEELEIESQKSIYTRIPDLFEPESDATEAEKIMILSKMLQRTYYGDNSYDYGIQSLMDNNLILGHYPLHDGDYFWNNYGPLCYRQVLHEYWSRRPLKYQPLDTIERYYGTEVAIYFTWFGFYIQMLMISALVGVVLFIFGTFIYPSDHVYIDELCNSDAFLCPLCPTDSTSCEEVLLKEYCTYAKATYFFDNPCTVTFAIFMSLWSSVYYELWKRRQSKLRLKWNLRHVETDYMTRVEYVRQTTERKLNKFTGEIEPYVPLIVMVYRYTISVVVCFFIILLIIIAVLLEIMYRVTVLKALRELTNYNLQYYAHFISGMTSAILTVIIIKLFAMMASDNIISNYFKVYGRIALYLTDIELHRTQVEHDNAYIYKLWILSFVNYYLPVIYIAFFKGRFFRYPGDESTTGLLRDLQMDLCPPGGCLMPLSTQIFFILIVKEVSVKILAYLLMLLKMNNKQTKLTQKTKEQLLDDTVPQWEKDYALLSNKQNFLIPDYMEMVLQYGLVTFFIASCPLSPLVVLIYNIVEIRLDARKLTKYYRRPVPRRLPGIGAWGGIMQAITILGTITNAFVIAFTSDIVPREIYRIKNGGLNGYVNSSMSLSFHVEQRTLQACYYKGLRYPEDHPQKFAHTEQFWIEIAVRLIVAVIFEHIVLGLAGILAYAIPDIPFTVKAQLSYEREKRKERQS